MFAADTSRRRGVTEIPKYVRDDLEEGELDADVDADVKNEDDGGTEKTPWVDAPAKRARYGPRNGERGGRGRGRGTGPRQFDAERAWQEARITDILNNRGEGVEGRIRALAIPRPSDRAKMPIPRLTERLQPSFTDHIATLWREQGGRCLATGIPFEFAENKTNMQRTDITPKLLLLHRPQFGDRFVPGNVAIVSAFFANIVTYIGDMQTVLDRILATSDFIKFKRSRGEWDAASCATLAAWDEVRGENGSGTKCESFMKQLRPRIVSTLTTSYPNSSRIDEHVSAGINLHDTIQYACDQCIAQKGRCYLSGIKMCSVPKSSPYYYDNLSVDRIDSNSRHVAGEFRLSSKFANQMRMMLSVRRMDECVLGVRENMQVIQNKML